ncbi:carbamoyl phosphate synthase small subunit [Alteribacillus iranensis]|uniref:Carbamoyl phosphate synthase small chain n=1 Tax=Alteribacillus iranensis TaxID=930128 RepID=A0A1I2A978_9BACI|nr:carbamoyl phosphate synthase small subunit [Alteribacillus iranensis]SFE40422.1 carbamoyl-phosphate synthase small subunit [Alteribacillus iranensis]
MNRKLILENGAVFHGEGIGSDKEIKGEVVFTTSMTGYQETLSNPSNYGQIVTWTYPLAGGYGINRDDFEALNPAAGGMVVKESAEKPSNFRSISTLNEWLKLKSIPGISGVDTRRLTLLLRKEGSLRGCITAADADTQTVVNELKNFQPSCDQVGQVSTKNAYHAPGNGHRVVLMDFGAKHSLSRQLIGQDCDMFVLPYHATADEIFSYHPDGVVLSNGPGNPEDLEQARRVVQSLIGKVPIFGIGLGYQLLALACGANVVKMHTGHRGSNHPVKNLAKNKVDITYQNHGYVVETDSLQETDLEVTHVHINDGTPEGVSHRAHPAFGVQFYPEGAPGPEDTVELFDDFIEMMETYNNQNQPIKGMER